VKVLVLEQLSEAQLARVRAAAGPASVVTAPAGEGRSAALADAEVVFGAVGRDALPTARRLRWIHVPLTFVDGYLFPSLVASDVTLTSTKDCVGTHLAEQAFGLLLAITRSIAAAVRVPRWDVRLTLRANARDLAGQTMGVIGLSGSAVRPAVARRAAAFGMRVVAVDPEARSPVARAGRDRRPGHLGARGRGSARMATAAVGPAGPAGDGVGHDDYVVTPGSQVLISSAQG
jgi:phosphoglycerate dehydrogenase-like enzyme